MCHQRVGHLKLDLSTSVEKLLRIERSSQNFANRMFILVEPAGVHFKLPISGPTGFRIYRMYTSYEICSENVGRMVEVGKSLMATTQA